MKESKKNKIKIVTVLIFAILIAIGMWMSYRATYLQTLEIGEEYLDVFYTNMNYKYKIMLVNFALFFIIFFVQNIIIKRGLKPFFKDDGKEMPKLPNKSIAFILAGIFSIIISPRIIQKTMLGLNSIWTGTTDPIFNLDIGFYFFQKPFIELILKYLLGIIIIVSLYMAIYYIAVFNIYLSGIDKEMLRKSKFIKQLKLNAFLIILTISAYVFLNTYNVVLGQFISLKDTLNTKIVGAGITDITIKVWGYRILVLAIIISGILILKNVGKENLKKIIYSVLIVPGYLVVLFVVMLLFSLLYVNNSRLDKEKQYIGYNIEYTKKAYNINIREEEIESSETIKKQDLRENEDIIDNITLVNEETTLKNLQTLQTNSGYYTYRNTKLLKYTINGKDTSVYVSPREMVSSSDTNTYNNKTYEYTHGYGSIISYASKTEEDGNVAYVQKNFDSTDKQVLVSEPRIYFGTETNNTIITNINNKTEFDYPINSTTSADYKYSGNAGIKANWLDRVILSIMKKNVNVAFSSGLNENSKVIMNRNIIDRAKTIMPDLVYDEKPYLVITDEGKQVWVLDAYSISNSYPYSQKTIIQIGESKREINYIRNSVKVLIDAYDGTVNFYITDSTDPIIMAYSKLYPNLFKNQEEIPESISSHFVYSEYLYNVQAEILKHYHNVSEDVLYRGDDFWNYATYSATKVAGSETKIQPYYTMVKTQNDENKIGLVIPYTLYGKQNIVSYLIGTVDQSNQLNLTLYRYAQGSNVIGPKQLEKVIEEDENISKEIEAVNVTGTKVTKNIIVVPVNNSLLYVEPVYQQQLNEKNAIPLLKKVIVASGNKVAVGNNLKEALENLVSQSATNIKVDNTDTTNDLINTIIDANKNLKESTKANNYEMIGKDINKIQQLINQLEQMQEKNKTALEDTKTDNKQTNTISK